MFELNNNLMMNMMMKMTQVERQQIKHDRRMNVTLEHVHDSETMENMSLRLLVPNKNILMKAS